MLGMPVVVSREVDTLDSKGKPIKDTVREAGQVVAELPDGQLRVVVWSQDADAGVRVVDRSAVQPPEFERPSEGNPVVVTTPA